MRSEEIERKKEIEGKMEIEGRMEREDEREREVWMLKNEKDELNLNRKWIHSHFPHSFSFFSDLYPLSPFYLSYHVYLSIHSLFLLSLSLYLYLDLFHHLFLCPSQQRENERESEIC
jgi:hypothetical protein